jgi:recombination protein RecT
MTEEQGQIQKAKMPTALAKIQEYVNNPDVRTRLKEMLGERAGAFGNSIINVFRNTAALQKCEPSTVMSAAMVAASMNLPIDPALGYAAIVPYGNSAQFQIMYKGLIQLCIRSGQYARIHNTEVYKDELKSYNPLTGKVEFNDLSTFKMRDEKNIANVVGYYSYFKLVSGFEGENFITTAEAMAHGKRFSKAYQYDIQQGKKASLWTLDPVAMGRKTSLKMLLSKYGIMSLEMQNAFIEESEDFNDELQSNEPQTGVAAVKEKIARGRKVGSKNKAKPVESTEVQKETVEAIYHCSQCEKDIPEKEVVTDSNNLKCCPDCNNIVEVKAISETQTNAAPETTSTEKKESKFVYRCSKGHDFDVPVGKEKLRLCPKCLTHLVYYAETGEPVNG